MINRICCWLEQHIQRDRFNKTSLIVVLVYYYVGLLSYITHPFRPIYRIFVASSSSAVVIRAILTIIICVYSLLVLVVNKEKCQWKWLVIFVYILLFTLISTIISPQNYTTVYVSNDNYGVVYWVRFSAGYNKIFSMFLSSISDFAIAFCFLFILPIVLKSRKQLAIILLPIVAIGILECVYSLVFERGEYIKLLNFSDPEYGGYHISIGATFGNKQDWGAFATLAFVSSLFLIALFQGKKLIIVKILLVLCSLILFVFTVASLCKTAIVVEFVFSFFFLAYCSVVLFKKNKIAFTILISFVSLILIATIMFYSIPSLHSSGILAKLYNVTYSFIIDKLFDGILFKRTEIWVRLINNMRTYNLFFGLSKAGIATYSQVVTVEGQSTLHNGFAYFFGSYGLIGFSIYLILMVIVIKRLFELRKVSATLMIMFFGVFMAAIIFSLIEAEVLIVSGSIPIFIFNIMLCSFSKGMHDNEKEYTLYEI